MTSNFSFSHSVFKTLAQQTCKNKGLFGKGLNVAKMKIYILMQCRYYGEKRKCRLPTFSPSQCLRKSNSLWKLKLVCVVMGYLAFSSFFHYVSYSSKI